MDNKTVNMTIEGRKTFIVTLEDNTSADALKDMLSKGEIVVEMEDYGNMEKVGPLHATLPQNNKLIKTEPGDVILYQGKYLVVYYAANLWNLTRLGKINGVTAEELKTIMGDGRVIITLTSN